MIHSPRNLNQVLLQKTAYYIISFIQQFRKAKTKNRKEIRGCQALRVERAQRHCEEMLGADRTVLYDDWW